MELEPVNDKTEWVTFIDAKNKGTSNIQNQVFSETYSQLSFKFSFQWKKWGKREKKFFSLYKDKPERNKNGFVGWGPSASLVLLAREGKLLSLDSHLAACLRTYNLLQIIFNIKTLFYEELFTLAPVHFSSASTGNNSFKQRGKKILQRAGQCQGFAKQLFGV